MNIKDLPGRIRKQYSASSTDPVNWRKSLLSGLLFGITMLGILAFGVHYFLAAEAGLGISIAIYAAACLVLLIITLLRDLPYRLRSIILLIVVYVVGVVSLSITGLAGNGLVFLFAFPWLSSIFLGGGVAIISLVISLGTFASIGMWLDGGQAWLSAGLTFAIITTITTISMTILITRLEESWKSERELLEQMAVERTQMEQRVFDRTQVLERRLGQIYTAAEISRTISAVLDRQTLLQQVVDLVQHRFELYYVGVFLVDDQHEYAVLQAGTGEAGQKMIAEGHRLKIGGTSMVGWAVANRQPRIALDVGSESVHFRNPHLPMTLSEMALPMISGTRVLGALTIQSGQPDAFDQDDITVLKAIADTLATALENADLFQELETRLDEIRTMHSQYLSHAWSEVPRQQPELTYTYRISSIGESELPTGIKFPVTLRGQPIGQLTLHGEKDQLTGEDLAFIDAVTTEAAIALENARLLEENQRRAQQEHLLGEISKKAQQYMDLDMVLKTAVQEVRQALKAPKVRIRLSNEKDRDRSAPGEGNERNSGKQEPDSGGLSS